jgi:hypothetical protein
MTIDEALKVFEAWLEHVERQRIKALQMQRLAALAKTDPAEAKRRMRVMDRQPRVFDGARLEPAVRKVLKHFNG